MKAIDNVQRARMMGEEVNFYAEAVKASEEFRAEYATRLKVVKSENMPFEYSKRPRHSSAMGISMPSVDAMAIWISAAVVRAMTVTASVCPPRR